MIEIVVPDLGEAMVDGRILRWRKQIGDAVALDEALFDLATDKADVEIPSPVAGILVAITAGADAWVKVGDVVGRVDTRGAHS